MTGIDSARIVAEILKGYALPPWGFHGVTHWARVLENGLKLAERTGADVNVVTLFALFHDSRRIDDGEDYGHGGRGAELAAELRGVVYDLPDPQFEWLCRACERHTGGRTDASETVLTCWDADRLDLGRVGVIPNPKYLCTAAGKSYEMIAWAYPRSVAEVRPAVVGEWGIPSPAWR